MTSGLWEGSHSQSSPSSSNCSVISGPIYFLHLKVALGEGQEEAQFSAPLLLFRSVEYLHHQMWETPSSSQA